MTFDTACDVYMADNAPRLRETTLAQKRYCIEGMLKPYFGGMLVGDIDARSVIAWENELLECRTSKGKPYSATCLNTICSQFSAIMNHLVRFYGLPSNPVRLAGKIGAKDRREMQFWTKDEYLRFSDAVADKPYFHLAFEILFWCGLRVGEMLALTPPPTSTSKCRASTSESRWPALATRTCSIRRRHRSPIAGHNAEFPHGGAGGVPEAARTVEPGHSHLPFHDQAPAAPRDDAGCQDCGSEAHTHSRPQALTRVHAGGDGDDGALDRRAPRPLGRDGDPPLHPPHAGIGGHHRGRDQQDDERWRASVGRSARARGCDR